MLREWIFALAIWRTRYRNFIDRGKKRRRCGTTSQMILEEFGDGRSVSLTDSVI